MTQAGLARALGISRPAVSWWLSGRSRPTAALRARLEILTSGAVPAQEWATAMERRALRETRPLVAARPPEAA